MICDICKNGAICKYRELYENACLKLNGARSIGDKTVGELPEFTCLAVDLICKYYQNLNNLGGLSYIPPTPVPCTTPQYNPYFGSMSGR